MIEGPQSGLLSRRAPRPGTPDQRHHRHRADQDDEADREDDRATRPASGRGGVRQGLHLESRRRQSDREPAPATVPRSDDGGGRRPGRRWGRTGRGWWRAGAANTIQTRPLITVDGNIAPGAALIGLQIAVDDRTNSLLIAGSETDLETIRALIDNLEQAPIEQRLFEVYKLRNQAAADVANALTSFITSSLAAYQVNGAAASYYTAYQQLAAQIVIVAEPVSNTILLSATPKYFTEMKRLIERIDAQPPQVVIQVTLADMQLTNAQEFGIEVGMQSPVLFNRGGLTSPGFNFNNVSLPLGSTNATEQGNVGFQGLSNLGVGRISTTGQGVRRVRLLGLQPVVPAAHPGPQGPGPGRHPEPPAGAGDG